MKNIKITGILVSAGLIVALGTGLIAYNTNEEVSSKKTLVAEATDSPNITTEETSEKIDVETIEVEEDSNSSKQNNTNEVLSKQLNSSNSTEESNNLNTPNDSSTNNTNKDTVEQDNTNEDESNNSTSTQPNPEVNKPEVSKPEVSKPEVDKPVVTPPTNKPDNENTAPPTASANFVAEIEQAIFQQVNTERLNNGLPALSYNNTMQKYARIKSQDMGDRNYFSHENPEGQLITNQMQKDGVSYQAWGENIAYIQSSSSNSSLAKQFMTNWMNSSGHRANILSDSFTSIGIGVYKIGNTYYATQEFYK